METMATNHSREMIWQRMTQPIREVTGSLQSSQTYLTRLFTEKRRVVSPKKRTSSSKKIIIWQLTAILKHPARKKSRAIMSTNSKTLNLFNCSCPNNSCSSSSSSSNSSCRTCLNSTRINSNRWPWVSLSTCKTPSSASSRSTPTSSSSYSKPLT
jgi:hypothetical protein